eukprot:7112700-Pyramimonas_sp.AAC.1
MPIERLKKIVSDLIEHGVDFPTPFKTKLLTRECAGAAALLVSGKVDALTHFLNVVEPWGRRGGAGDDAEGA